MKDEYVERLRNTVTDRIEHYEKRSMAIQGLREQSIAVLRDVLFHIDLLREHSDFIESMENKELKFYKETV